MKKLFFSLALFLSFSVLAFAQTTATPLISPAPTFKPILYVRQGCPHCAKVEEFLNKYSLNDQLTIVETYNNDVNQKALEAWWTKLNVTDPNQQGVPFLVTDEKTYFVGDVPIIDYFAKKNNITIEPTTYSASTADTLFLVFGGLFLFGVLGYGVYTGISKKK